MHGSEHYTRHITYNGTWLVASCMQKTQHFSFCAVVSPSGPAGVALVFLDFLLQLSASFVQTPEHQIPFHLALWLVRHSIWVLKTMVHAEVD